MKYFERYALRLLLAAFAIACAGADARAQKSWQGERGAAARTASVNLLELARQEALSPQSVAPTQPEAIHSPRALPGDLPVAEGTAAAPSPAGPAGAGAALGVASPAAGASFIGMADNLSIIPPDTHGAAGPNHLVVALNGGGTAQGGVRVMTRTGTPLVTVGLTAFFGGDGTPNGRGLQIASHAFDPRVYYDQLASRWILVATADSNSATSSILVAVSVTPDPSAGWSIFQVDVDPADRSWADYPSVGFNKDWVVVQVNMFPNPGVSPPPPFASSVFVFNKAQLAPGGTGAHTKFTRTDVGSTQAPAVTLDPALPVVYLVSNWNSAAGVLQLFTVSGPVGSETLSTGPQVAAGEGWRGSPGSDFAPQLGSTRRIQTNDQRVQAAVYRHGSLWVAQTVFLPAGAPPARSAVQWWEVAPATGQVVQRGRIDDPTGVSFHAFPSIAVNGSRDVLVGYSRFSRNQYASANYSLRAASDPPGTLRDGAVLKAGEGVYDKNFGSTRNRWGDYSASMVDPADDNAFWTVQEFAAAPAGTGANSGRWGVWWGRVSPSGPPAVPPVAVRAVSPAEAAAEGAGSVQVTVARAGGDAAAPCLVDYATSDGTARDREDYMAAFGTLTFAPGETQKTVTVFLTDDAHAEPAETFALALTNPRNCSVESPAAASVQIAASDAAGAPNPVRNASFDNRFFVRQHYLDFFNREPDAEGLQFWTGQLDSCGSDQACRDARRENVSAAFFLSIEFQQTGYLVYRAYQAAFGRRVQNAVPLTLREFLPDTQQIGRGVIVGQGSWEAQIEANRVAFFDEFVGRADFAARYPSSMSAAAFVDALNQNTGGSLSADERNALVNQLSSGAVTRARALRTVVEDADFAAREKNRAFVLAQYFGYLRRNPNDAPNVDFSGFDFWLGKLDEHGGNFAHAQMVKSFIVSDEYKLRFGP